jgi:hypothetical protein
MWQRRLPFVLGLVLAGFLVLFSFDVFEGGEPLLDQLVGLVIHNAPSLLILAGLAIARRSERAGGWVFMLLALASAVVFDDPIGRVITVVPLLVIGTLFLWNARAAVTESPPG